MMKKKNGTCLCQPSFARLSPMTIKVYLDLALQGKNGPSAKDLRMMAFMKNLYGE